MTNDPVDPDDPRVRIQDPDERLLRPIPSGWIQSGTLSIDAFLLNAEDRNDSNRLSISRASAVTPQQAYEIRAGYVKERCERMGTEYKAPHGVVAVSVEQIDSVKLIDAEEGSTTSPLTAWDDSMKAGVPPEHGHIDYSAVADDRGKHKFVAKVLTAFAEKNGWLYLGADREL